MDSSRSRTILALLLALSLLSLVPVDVRAGGSGRSSGHASRSSSSGISHRGALRSSRGPVKGASCARHSHGEITRDPKAVSEVRRTQPKRPGYNRYEVDHAVRLSTGGRDDPNNMEWLPREWHENKTKPDLRREERVRT